MNLLLIILPYAIGEGVASIIFFFLRKEFEKKQPDTGSNTNHRFFGLSATIFKGLLERLVIYLGLLAHFPQVLIVFGALKIATRITPSENHKISNDYFLIGNLLSMGLSILFYVLHLQLTQWFPQ